MRRTDFLKLGLGVALTPLIKVLPADAQPLDVIADEPLPEKPYVVTITAMSACSGIDHFYGANWPSTATSGSANVTWNVRDHSAA